MSIKSMRNPKTVSTQLAENGWSEGKRDERCRFISACAQRARKRLMRSVNPTKTRWPFCVQGPFGPSPKAIGAMKGELETFTATPTQAL